MISKIRNFLHRVKNSRADAVETNPFLRFAPAGHFYSPIPDYATLTEQSNQAIDDNKIDASIAGVNLNETAQLRLLEEIAHFYPQFPYHAKGPNLRYTFDQVFYCQSDATYLYGLLRKFKPRKLIEVGSGHSSALILDTNGLFLENKLDCTFIEPFPQRLLSVLQTEEKKRVRLLETQVQNVPMSVFSVLESNDVLFIDSSHVSKYGSDVNYLMFQILPSLQKGVIVHIHDIFYPFEYPREWLLEGRAWNEAYLVHAFLQGNSDWEILLFADYAGKKFRSYLADHMPLCLANTGGSLWMRKLR